MGTTLLGLALGGTEAVIAHVGDSRAYLVRGETCTQLTNDHSRVGEMLRMRMISAEQAANHPARSQLTRSLGGDPFVQVDLVRQADPAPRHARAVQRRPVGRGGATRDRRGRRAARRPAPSPPRWRPPTGWSRLAIERGSTDNVSAVLVHLTSDQPIPPAGGRRFRLRRSRP